MGLHNGKDALPSKTQEVNVVLVKRDINQWLHFLDEARSKIIF